MDEVILDTNCFLRYLLKDNLSQATKVKGFINSCKQGKIKILVPTVVIFELNYVLLKVYKFEKLKVIERLKIIVHEPSFNVENKNILALTFNIYTDNKIDFADSFLIAKSKIESSRLFTFDKKLKKLTSC